MGARVKVTRQEHTAAELRALSASCVDGAQVRRILALAMVLDGHARTEAATLNGMDRQTLRELVVKGPDPETHKVVRWRCVDLQAEVARRWSV